MERQLRKKDEHVLDNSSELYLKTKYIKHIFIFVCFSYSHNLSSSCSAKKNTRSARQLKQIYSSMLSTLDNGTGYWVKTYKDNGTDFWESQYKDLSTELG